MGRPLPRLFACFAASAILCGPAGAQAPLEPPFGLKWGDSPEKLISWASRHSLNVNISLRGRQPALHVVGVSPETGLLPGSPASSVEGRFLHGRLYEVTVHYRQPDANRVENDFNKLRKELITEYGELTPNLHDRSVKDQFATRTLSYHREPVKGLLLLLAYTEVEDLLRKSRGAEFSLIYRNDNFRLELEKKQAPAHADPGR